MCTYETCRDPDQLFDTRGDWIRHENGHRKVIRCPEHQSRDFNTRRDLEVHLKKNHTNYDCETSEMLIEHASDSISISVDKDCPICLSSTSSLRALQNHIALHLERLSLFSLPRDVSEDQEEPGEADSDQAHIAADDSRDEDFSTDGAIAQISDSERSASERDSQQNSDEARPDIETSMLSSNGGSTRASEHWLLTVFGQDRPTTPFRTSGMESSFHGSHQHRIREQIEAKYDLLETFPFENGLLEIRFYLREDDRRARLLCRTERDGRRYQASLPCTMLRISRKDSCLQLCQVDERKRWVLWTNLRFPSYERMVLFFCAFLALKAQDEAHPIEKMEDYLLQDEIPYFSAIIIDDGYEHVLMALKDTGSSGIRLEASVARGPLKKCPIWTAFINYHVASLQHDATPWLCLAESRKVHLRDLHRYIFSSDYTPQYGPNGEHELWFKESRGEAFR